ncbi:MAG: Gfo/Idh/MocA family oxidoreductase [Pyrinomonadaceae bacterium]|nr:Gfo/Idh/MocA family oxidoreductase [Pyrinomonadaceae bacterium]
MKRRDFIKNTAVSGLGIMSAPNIIRARGKEKVRLGLIGVGLRGTWHLKNSLERDDVEVTAICDIDPERINLAQSMIEKAVAPKAEVFDKGDYAYRDLLKKSGVDAVIISTPWLWHVPMSVDSMKAGKYVGVEVSGASSVDECWEMVRVHEETGTHLMFLENVCYRRDVMAVLNMVRKGIFGELIHCQGGYQHDLRHVKFDPGVEFGEKGRSESKWRTQHSIKRNGELYPTHGLGPVMEYLDLNRGNRMISLNSQATKSRGLHNYIVEKGGADHPNARVEFKLGDVVTTMISCANGETVVLSHDTNLPRPYSLGFRVQGTRGLWMKDGNQIYIEGVSEKSHRWEPSKPYIDKYDHWMWKKYENVAAGAGHGGMDFFVLNDFIQSVKREIAPPIDVYDGAAMMVITPLSERSISEGGTSQQIPDFTNGRWIKRKPIFGLDKKM